MKTKLPNFVILLVLTTLTVLMWLGFNIYRSFLIKPSPPVAEGVLFPLNPVLDEVAIREIEQRVVVENTVTEEEEEVIIEEFDEIVADDLEL